METITKTKLTVSSTAFDHGEYIPSVYTCEGEDINPPLFIKDLPENTKSLALIVDDPDAPNGTFNHWLVWNILPKKEIIENSIPGTQGSNSFQKNNYGGPCPPSGTHRYFFKFYALDSMIDLNEGAPKDSLLDAMQGHILAEGELVGLYQKK